jgi:lipid A 4'-phosphatase
MTYLKILRTRRVLLLFLTSSLLFVWFPDLDLRVSGLFHRGGRFFLAHSWWTETLHESVGYFICIALASVVGIYAFNRVSGRSVCRVDGKTVSYLLLVLVLGAGLIVNVILKNGFGRARPRNVAQFGGSQEFSPAFVVSAECASNCSFASGDSSGAFFSLALALALPRRRALLVASAVYGGLVSFSRIASGAHYFSDTVVSFFVMWITADALYHYMLLPRHAAAAPHGSAVCDPGGLPEREIGGSGTAPNNARTSGGEIARGAR